MHDKLGNHASQKVLDEADGETEASPVVAVLHNLEAVTLELDIAVKVHLVEGLHGDLVGATVLETVGLLLEVEVVLNRTARQLGLVRFAGGDGRDDEPPSCQEGQISDEGEEDEGLEASANLPGQPERNSAQEGEQDLVVERVGARPLSGEGSILDGRILDGNQSARRCLFQAREWGNLQPAEAQLGMQHSGCPIANWESQNISSPLLSAICWVHWTYLGGADAAVLVLLKGRGGGLGSLDELELALAARDARGLGHLDGTANGQLAVEVKNRGSRECW